MKAWLKPLVLAASSALVGTPQSAAADNSAQVLDQPNPLMPMAVVDSNALLGFQPRAWMVTNGGRLVSKATEVATYGWLSTNIEGINSGLGAASWGMIDGITQRVFYTKADRVQRADFLDDAFQGTAILPSNLTDKFSNTDVAAMAYIQSNVTRNAVASVSTTGRVCVWDGPATGFLAVNCSNSGVAATASPEVVGATTGGHVMFAYRGANQQLRRSRKIAGSTTYQHQTLPFPPGTSGILPPLGLNYSQISGSLDLVVADNSARVWVARMRPQLTGIDSWHLLPPLPEPLANARSSLAVATHTQRAPMTFSGVTKTRVFARSESHHLYMLESDQAGNFDNATWNLHELQGAQRWFSLADAQTLWTGLAYAAPGHAFGVGGDAYWFFGDTTFQQFDGQIFRDHLRPIHSASAPTIGFDTTNAWHQSHDVSLSRHKGGLPLVGATGTRQNNTSPWQVMVSNSLNGGQGFTGGVALTPIAAGTAGATSLFDPDLSIGDDGMFYHVATQTQVTQLGDLHCTTGSGRDIIHRRGSDASQLAALSTLGPDAILLASGDVEHGSILSVGEGESQQTHFLYWDHDDEQITYGRIAGGVVTSALSPLKHGQGELIRDAAGHVYGYRRVASAGLPTLCRLWPASSDGQEDCGAVGLPHNTFTPTPMLIPFGTVNGPDRCNGQSGAQACIDAASSVVIVADPVKPRTFYAAFQHVVADRSHIFVTRSADDSLNSWTLPVNVVETTLGTPDFIDPSLAVDANGDLTVSLIQIYRGAQDPQMKNVLAVSQNGGATFHVEFVPSVLKAAALPFNCASKRYDLGNQRKAMSYGGRSLHSLRISFPPPTHELTVHGAYGVSPYATVY